MVGYVLMNRAVNAPGWVQLVSNVVLYVAGLVPVVVESSSRVGCGVS